MAAVDTHGVAICEKADCLSAPQMLDHACQERWEEKSNCPQQADDDEHPEEDAVNHHRDILPVFLYLRTQEHSLHYAGCGNRRTPLSFLPSLAWFPWQCFWLG